MSLVLLSTAALLAQSLRNLEHQDFGFDLKGRYIAWINPTLGNDKPEQMEQLFRRIDDSLREIPGVRMVPALYAPMTGDSWNDGVRIQGRPEPGPKEDTGAGYVRVMPGFFEAIGARMIMGRPFTEDDTAATPNVAVVNEAFVRRFFKGQNPIGQHFGPNRLRYASTYEIVGVVKDIRYMTYDYKSPSGQCSGFRRRRREIRRSGMGTRREVVALTFTNIVDLGARGSSSDGREGVES